MTNSGIKLKRNFKAKESKILRTFGLKQNSLLGKETWPGSALTVDSSCVPPEGCITLHTQGRKGGALEHPFREHGLEWQRLRRGPSAQGDCFQEPSLESPSRETGQRTLSTTVLYRGASIFYLVAHSPGAFLYLQYTFSVPPPTLPGSTTMSVTLSP